MKINTLKVASAIALATLATLAQASNHEPKIDGNAQSARKAFVASADAGNNAFLLQAEGSPRVSVKPRNVREKSDARKAKEQKQFEIFWKDFTRDSGS